MIVTGVDAAELGRLRWRCRRGIRELDVLLTAYVDTRYAQAGAADQEAFRSLLEQENSLIYAYCLRREAPPGAALRAVVAAITANSPGDP